MNKSAYFFQGDSLLIPMNVSDEEIDKKLHIELANDFDSHKIFIVSEGIEAVSVSEDFALPATWKKIPIRQVLEMAHIYPFSHSTISEMLRTCHLVQWRVESRFCGTCGNENIDAEDSAHRICPACGRSEFPRICPAIIVLITDSDNRILLAHNKKFKQGMYSHISGFNEAGESLEETVVREVKEEVNIDVCNIKYVKSQSWPFPNSLMVGFKANYLSGTVRPDGEEIEDAGWFSKDKLPEIPRYGSLSRFMIDRWVSGELWRGYSRV